MPFRDITQSVVDTVCEAENWDAVKGPLEDLGFTVDISRGRDIRAVVHVPSRAWKSPYIKWEGNVGTLTSLAKVKSCIRDAGPDQVYVLTPESPVQSAAAYTPVPSHRASPIVETASRYVDDVNMSPNVTMSQNSESSGYAPSPPPKKKRKNPTILL